MAVGDRCGEQGDVRSVNSFSRTRNSHTSSSTAGCRQEEKMSSHEDFGMRVGRNYQAEIPNLLQCAPIHDTNSSKVGASLVWSPNPQKMDANVDFYLELATSKYNYSQEQALGLLLWHHHNVDVAISDLPNFSPTPDDWTPEDKVLFEQAFAFMGKNFSKIHSMMPEKSVGSLVKYYYLWKKGRRAVSSMDQKTQKDNESKKSSKNELEMESAFKHLHAGEEFSRNSFRGQEYWMSSKPRIKSRVPYNLELEAKELNMIACGHGHRMLKQLDNELINLKRKVVTNKQVISTVTSKLTGGINRYRLPESTINSKWSNTELLLAVQGFKHFGKDFQAISEVLGNKSEHLVRNFYLNYRSRYNLDNILVERMRLKSNSDDKVCEPGKGTRWQFSPPPPPLLKQNVFNEIDFEVSNKQPFHGNKHFMQQPPSLFKHADMQK